MINHDNPDLDVEVDERPTYDEVAVGSITGAFLGAAAIAVAGFAWVGLQSLWPHAPLPLGLIEVTLPGIGITAAVGGVLKGVIDAALGIRSRIEASRQ